MTITDQFPSGSFIPGTSPLHRADPRVKLLVLLLAVIATFSARHFISLAAVAVVAAILAAASGQSMGRLYRRLRPLRWLLLFTLLVHLLFSPGRTLYGLSWLSHDGLLRGLMVSIQLLLAVLFSSLVTLTTPPGTLAHGLERLLAPLERLRIPISRLTRPLPLVFHLIPRLMTGVRQTLARFREEGGRRPSVDAAGALLGKLVIDAVEIGDEMAHKLARGQDPLEEAGRLSSPGTLGRIDGALLAGVCPVLLLLWWW